MPAGAALSCTGITTGAAPSSRAGAVLAAEELPAEDPSEVSPNEFSVNGSASENMLRLPAILIPAFNGGLTYRSPARDESKEGTTAHLQRLPG
jgi:hypothetical protein